MVILEIESLKHSRPFFLKHYRAESDGCTTRLFCDSCASYSRRRVQNYILGCTKTDGCRCNVCLRQPPTLKSLASHSVFNVLFDLDHFVLSSTTTYEECKFVANSKKVSSFRLLPPDSFPDFRYVYYVLSQSPTARIHWACCALLNYEEIWSVIRNVKFSRESAVVSIVNDKQFWWCSHCHRPLFVNCYPCRGSEH